MAQLNLNIWVFLLWPPECYEGYRDVLCHHIPEICSVLLVLWVGGAYSEAEVIEEC